MVPPATSFSLWPTEAAGQSDAGIREGCSRHLHILRGYRLGACRRGGLANPNPAPFFRDIVGCPHSVVTAHLVDEAGHPTLQARDEILDFLAERLCR
jgi:hypothetical protein